MAKPFLVMIIIASILNVITVSLLHYRVAAIILSSLALATIVGVGYTWWENRK